VFEQLEAAVKAKDEDEITDALSAANSINFEHDLIKEGQDFLDAERKKREDAKKRNEAAEAELGEAAAAEAAAERLAAAKKAVEDAVAMPDDDLAAKLYLIRLLMKPKN
jgi:hypothetical protein